MEHVYLDPARRGDAPGFDRDVLWGRAGFAMGLSFDSRDRAWQSRESRFDPLFVQQIEFCWRYTLCAIADPIRQKKRAANQTKCNVDWTRRDSACFPQFYFVCPDKLGSCIPKIARDGVLDLILREASVPIAYRRCKVRGFRREVRSYTDSG
jgi:hypothetical protein